MIESAPFHPFLYFLQYVQIRRGKKLRRYLTLSFISAAETGHLNKIYKINETGNKIVKTQVIVYVYKDKTLRYTQMNNLSKVLLELYFL